MELIQFGGNAVLSELLSQSQHTHGMHAAVVAVAVENAWGSCGYYTLRVGL